MSFDAEGCGWWKVVLFPLLLVAACLTAGLYGALHNQISYTVSTDDFHAFKFHQFDIPEELRGASGHRSWGGTLPGGWGLRGYLGSLGLEIID